MWLPIDLDNYFVGERSQEILQIDQEIARKSVNTVLVFTYGEVFVK